MSSPSPRGPCPCGSGRRYKACHGAQGRLPAVRRPFAGHPDEIELVAMRELLPSATARLTLTDDPDREVLLGSALPMRWPALARQDGRIVVGMQTGARSGDLDRDLGQALLAALDAPAGSPVAVLGVPGPGPRLTELAGPGPWPVQLHTGFDWWVDGGAGDDPAVADGLLRANDAIVPTEAVTGVRGAYWCRIGEREHLRWVLGPEDEELLDGLARMAVAGDGAGGATDPAWSLVPGGRYVGAFRALGLLIPVWDLPVGTGAAACAGPATELRSRLDAVLADPRPLTDPERRARAGLVGRQLTVT